MRQPLRERAFLPAALIVFTASGFAGLIYQSIWSHYLKLFLGHAAYAQTLVLAIFMGGMAVGAWLASRVSTGWRSLLLAYGIIEALIGLSALAFHDVFVHVTAWAFDSVIPGLGSPGAVQAFKWTLAALLILPQSVLLGMTFPFMTGGVLRMRPGRTGYAIAMLYFTNSLGAGIGVLASGFYFIPRVGLPGAMVAAGIVNLVVAAAIILLRRDQEPAAPAPAEGAAGAPRAEVPGLRLLLAVSCLTGLSSFMYEVGWIRMLSLVLGASTHSFEIMLSAFILGIAFGGLWVRRRIDAAGDTVRLLGFVQIAMGIAAIATIPVYGHMFEAMAAALQALSRSEGGYQAYHFVSHAIALAVMFPAAFFAGMTLPLITASLLRRGAGERAIGQVYAANTVGAIAGVVIAVHIGFPVLGLKNLIVAGAAIDLALGVVLLAWAGGRARRSWALGSGAVCAALVVAAFVGLHLDAHQLASGVYRLGRVPSRDLQTVELQVDGKTATVSVVRNDRALALLTNGKSDGAIRTGPGEPTDDEIMMLLLGALPQVLAPEAKRAANIGFGTGMTTHVLLASPTLESVDTVEIESAMLKVAPAFRPFNARALDDPRSRIHFEDAKTFFSARQAKYDVILSEPSNPWVSGVSSLFSIEFYRDVRRYLNDGGLLFQWVQTYEMTPVLLATIIKSLETSFPDYELWMPSHGDLIIVASKGGPVPRPDARALQRAVLGQELRRFHISTVEELQLHRVASSQALTPFFSTFGAPENTDFFPVLDLRAAQARFTGGGVDVIGHLFELGLPIVEAFDPGSTVPDPARLRAGNRFWLRRPTYADQAATLARYFRDGDRKVLEPLASALAADAVLVRAAMQDCRVGVPVPALVDAMASVAWLVNVHLPKAQREALWKRLAAAGCPLLGARERRWLALHGAVGALDPAAMAEAAGAILANGDATTVDLTIRAVGTRAMGLILDGRPADAQREFASWRGRLGDAASTQTLFRFLLAQVERGPIPAPGTAR